MAKTVEELIRESIGESEAVKTASDKSDKLDKSKTKKIATGLKKCASLPYKEDAYNAVCEIMKMASTSLDTALNELGTVDEKIKKLEKVAEIRQIIDDLIEAGVINKEDIFNKTAELIKKSDKELEIIKEAVKINSGSQNIFFEKSAEATTVKKGGMFGDVI